MKQAHSGDGGPLRQLGSRLARHGAIYAVGSGLGLALGLLQFAVLVHILPIAEFGQLAILLFLTALVALLCRIALVQGALVTVFRGADEEELDDDQDDEPRPRVDTREVLGTGLILSLALTAGLTAVAAVAAEPLSEFFIHASKPGAVVWATLAGGLEGVWRLIVSIPRFERRPTTYVLLTLLHVVLRLVAAIILVESGFGLEGAVAGFALGSAVSMVPGVFVSRHRFRPALNREHVRLLIERGSPFAIIAIGFLVFRIGDVYVVSLFVSDVDVAIYRAAGRIAMPISSLTGVLLFAWGPLIAGPMRGALQRGGALAEAGGRMVTYYWLLSLVLLVTLALSSELLLEVLAPGTYEDAAPLIPLIGIATAALAVMMAIYRTARFKNKRAVLQRLTVAMVVIFACLALLLVPRLGLYGAAAAVFAAPVFGIAVLLTFSQRGPNPLPVAWWRLSLATALAAACIVGGYLGGAAAGELEPLVRLGAVVVFPVLLLLSGALSRADARALLRVSREGLALGTLREDSPEALQSLPTADLEIVRPLARDGRSVAETATLLGSSERFVLERFVEILRHVASAGPPTSLDERIGRYLLRPGGPNDRVGDRLALEEDVDPLDLDALAGALEELRSVPVSEWPPAGGRSGQDAG